MSFRKYGGINRSSTQQTTRSTVTSTPTNLTSTFGQENSKSIMYNHIDMNGNSILHTNAVQFQDGTVQSTAYTGGSGGTTSSAQGPQGFQGNQGVTGPIADGTTGPQGAQGYQGYTGVQGYQGHTGPIAEGTTGPQGYQGRTGAQGFTGAQGYQGYTGAQGFTGAQGTTGIGTTGAQGNQGVTGAQGIPGSFAVSGATYQITTLTNSQTGDVTVGLYNPTTFPGSILLQSPNYLQFGDATQQTTAYTATAYTVKYTTDQTITTPANCRFIDIQVMGAGGACGISDTGPPVYYGGSGSGGNLIYACGVPMGGNESLTLSFSTTSGTGSTTVTYNGSTLAQAYNGNKGSNGSTGGTATGASPNSTPSVGDSSFATWTSCQGSAGSSGNTSPPSSAGAPKGTTYANNKYGTGQKTSSQNQGLGLVTITYHIA